MPGRRDRHAILPALDPARAARCLRPPLVPPALLPDVERARAAVRDGRPVLLRAAPAAGLRLARALHAAAVPGAVLHAAAGRRPALHTLAPGSRLYLDARRLAPDAILALAAVLDDAEVGVIVGLDTAARVPALVAPWLETTCVNLPDGAGPESPAGAVAVAADAAGPPHRLELVLTELAHELRNPLVTIKTFAEHLPALLEDGALRAQFADLTREGIARIDDVLENILAFARLENPRPRAVDLSPLLDALLAEAAPALAGRALTVRRAGTAATRCTADPAYLSYGLRNLFAGLAQEASPREELLVETQANGVVRVRFTPGGAEAARLRRLVAADDETRLGDPTLLPLAFTLARAALVRGGGTLDVQAEADGAATIVVRLPGAPAPAATT